MCKFNWFSRAKLRKIRENFICTNKFSKFDELYFMHGCSIDVTIKTHNKT